jgi:hypothetical protein
MSISDLVDTDRLRNLTRQFVDDQRSALEGFSNQAIERANTVLDEAQEAAEVHLEDSADDSNHSNVSLEGSESRLYDARLAEQVFPARVRVPVFGALTMVIAVVGVAGALVVRVSRHSDITERVVNEEESRLLGD